MNANNHNFILPVGTQIVSLSEVRGADGTVRHPRGAVSVVVQAPADYWHGYRVRFPDNFEATLHRQEMAILAHFQAGDAIDAVAGGGAALLAEYDLQRHVIYRCIVGSRAFGMDDAESDVDRRGIYLPPAELHWSLYGIPEQLDYNATEEVYWEAQKFVTLALKANPNVLECLYTPLVEHASPLASELLNMRDRFLSKLVYQTYNGYVLSQFKKLQADLRSKGEIKWKHVMHLLRLLLSGVAILEEGRVPVHVGSHRDRLLAVKLGEVSLEDCERWRQQLHEQMDAGLGNTALPDRPDYAAANAWLLRARRAMVSDVR
jgi:uncharacterized protein